MSSIVIGVALGALAWWLSVSRWRGEAWLVAICITAAVCFLVNGAGALLGTSVALSVITAYGLWTLGLRMLLVGPSRFGALALAVIVAGTAMAVLAVMQWGR